MSARSLNGTHGPFDRSSVAIDAAVDPEFAQSAMVSGQSKFPRFVIGMSSDAPGPWAYLAWPSGRRSARGHR